MVNEVYLKEASSQTLAHLYREKRAEALQLFNELVDRGFRCKYDGVAVTNYHYPERYVFEKSITTVEKL